MSQEQIEKRERIGYHAIKMALACNKNLVDADMLVELIESESDFAKVDGMVDEELYGYLVGLDVAISVIYSALLMETPVPESMHRTMLTTKDYHKLNQR